jgi:hypothetical protein
MSQNEVMFRLPLLNPATPPANNVVVVNNHTVYSEVKSYPRLEIDSPPETYDVMKKYVKTLKGVDGLSCEIGLRRGGGTKTIVDAFLENNDKRVHVCMDPYGNIIYTDIVGPHRSDYTDDMKNETLAELYRYAFDKRVNILFFNIEDSEFYRRFCDGVPVYNEEKQYINSYCFVHVDGQHDVDSVKLAADFFVPRISIDGIIIFDNTDHYNHNPIHEYMLRNKFAFMEDVLNKKVYKRVL